MKLDLAPELEDFVREKVESRTYRDEAEVVAEALRLLERFDLGSSKRQDALRAAVQAGVSDIAEGRFTTLNGEVELKAFFDEL
jgi:putative addiction module CopG family antidote